MLGENLAKGKESGWASLSIGVFYPLLLRLGSHCNGEGTPAKGLEVLQHRVHPRKTFMSATKKVQHDRYGVAPFGRGW